MEGLSAIQTNHLRHLKSYIEAQSKFYANCHQIMQDLHREMASTTMLSEGENIRPGVAAPQPPIQLSRPFQQFAQHQDQPLPPPPPPSDPYQDTNGGPPEAQMQQINLASPPPMPSSLKNADFF